MMSFREYQRWVILAIMFVACVALSIYLWPVAYAAAFVLLVTSGMTMATERDNEYVPWAMAFVVALVIPAMLFR